MSMYPPERQRTITELLLGLDDRRASVTQISERLGVTSETVRRDLDVLERRGLVRRVRGGAELLRTTPFEQALAARHAEQYAEKLVIAERVIDDLPDDGVVILDSGSLTYVCARAMPRDRSLMVVTNNLPAAHYLAGLENLRVLTLLGTLRGLTSAAVDVWTSREARHFDGRSRGDRRERTERRAGIDHDQPGGSGREARHAARCATAGGPRHLRKVGSQLVLCVRGGVRGRPDHHRRRGRRGDGE